jgi:toxin ParE1/3/4
MPQYRISNPARADIVDILRLSQTQFGDQARQRYQALILAALQALADTPYRIGSHDRDELAPGLRSYHLIYYASRPNKPMERSKAHVISCSIVWQTTT